MQILEAYSKFCMYVNFSEKKVPSYHQEPPREKKKKKTTNL